MRSYIVSFGKGDPGEAKVEKDGVWQARDVCLGLFNFSVADISPSSCPHIRGSAIRGLPDNIYRECQRPIRGRAYTPTSTRVLLRLSIHLDSHYRPLTSRLKYLPAETFASRPIIMIGASGALLFVRTRIHARVPYPCATHTAWGGLLIMQVPVSFDERDVITAISTTATEMETGISKKERARESSPNEDFLRIASF